MTTYKEYFTAKKNLELATQDEKKKASDISSARWEFGYVTDKDHIESLRWQLEEAKQKDYMIEFYQERAKNIEKEIERINGMINIGVEAYIQATVDKHAESLKTLESARSAFSAVGYPPVMISDEFADYFINQKKPEIVEVETRMVNNVMVIDTKKAIKSLKKAGGILLFGDSFSVATREFIEWLELAGESVTVILATTRKMMFCVSVDNGRTIEAFFEGGAFVDKQKSISVVVFKKES